MELTGQYFCSFNIKGQNFDEEFKVVLEANVSVFDKNGRLKKQFTSKLSSKQILIRNMMKRNLERGFDLSKQVFGEQVSTCSDETTHFKETESGFENTAEDSGKRTTAKVIHDDTKRTNSDKNSLGLTQKLRLNCFWVHLPENELGNSTESGLSGETPSIAVQQVTTDTSGVLHNVKKEPVGIDNSGFDNRRDNDIGELPSNKLQTAVKRSTLAFNQGCLTNVNDTNNDSEQRLSIIGLHRNYSQEKSLMENAQLGKDSIANEVIPTELYCVAKSSIYVASDIDNSSQEDVTLNRAESGLNSDSNDNQQGQLVTLNDVVEDQNKPVSNHGGFGTSGVNNMSINNQEDCADTINTLSQTQNMIIKTCENPDQANAIFNADPEQGPLCSRNEYSNPLELNAAENSSAVPYHPMFMSSSGQIVYDKAESNEAGLMEIERGENLTGSLSADFTEVASFETCSTFDMQTEGFTKVKPEFKDMQVSVGIDHTYKKRGLKTKRSKLPSKTLKFKSVRKKNRGKKHKLENIFDDDLNFLFSNLENNVNTFKIRKEEDMGKESLQAPETNLKRETEVQDVYDADKTEYKYQVESVIQPDIEYSNTNNSTDNTAEDVYGSATENNSSGRNCRRRCRKNISYQKIENFYDSVALLEDVTSSSSSSSKKSKTVKDSEYEPTELSDTPSYSSGEDHRSSFSDEEAEMSYYERKKKQKLKSKPRKLQIDLSEHKDKYEIIQVVSKEQKDRGKPIEDIAFSSFACTICCKNYQTKDEESLRTHIGLHLKGKLKCNVCGLECISEYNKRDHIKMDHPEKRNPSNYMVCEICGDKLLKGSRGRHMQYVHNISTYECSFCNGESQRKYLNKKELDEHMKSEHPDQLFSCKKCDKQFSVLGAYKTHKAKCKGKASEENICSICCSVFSNQVLLKRHIRYMHQKEKKYKFDLCPYAAFVKSRIDRHMAAAHLSEYKMGLDVRKPVFRGLRITKAQTSLPIHVV